MEGKNKPEYFKCVDIVTASAQKELVGPALIAVCTPVAVGFGLGAAALGGYLAGTILVGQLLAVLLANSGAIWDNAKKAIEMGAHGGKGGESHKAAVIGDTVGDPFKDTAGPALNPLIKVMNLVAILVVPLILYNYSSAIRLTIVGICVALIIFAIWLSKKEGIMTE
jgi:K(+)-stimulated pyrophosphate-energized sodium pump